MGAAEGCGPQVREMGVEPPARSWTGVKKEEGHAKKEPCVPSQDRERPDGRQVGS